MTTFTDQQARQNLEAVLESARRQGEVRIRDNKGREFSLRAIAPESPLDIPGVNLDLSADEIVQAIREAKDR